MQLEDLNKHFIINLRLRLAIGRVAYCTYCTVNDYKVINTSTESDFLDTEIIDVATLKRIMTSILFKVDTEYMSQLKKTTPRVKLYNLKRENESTHLVFTAYMNMTRVTGVTRK